MIYIKSDKEIELMRKPCQIVRDVLRLCEDKIKAGMTTKELDKIAYDYITSCGAKPSFLGYGGFPAATCISIDEQVVHGFPSDRIIEEDQIVSVDVGAYFNGFHGDAARSLYVGHISPRNLHEDPSVPNYGRRGVGVRLKRNMSIAIEPMINMGGYEVDIDGWKCVTSDGKPSAHYENTVLIGDNGVEILTL